MRAGAVAALALLAGLTAALALAEAEPPPSGEVAAVARRGTPSTRAPSRAPSKSALQSPLATTGGLEGALTIRIDGEPYLGANDMARLLRASKFWRQDIRKLVLKTRTHRVVVTDNLPFVVIDDGTVRLDLPVRSVAGELQLPVALLDSLPRDTTLAWLYHDVRRGRVVVLPEGGVVDSPRLQVQEGVTRLTFPGVGAFGGGAPEAEVVGRARAHFRVRFEGFFAGVLPDEVPPASLARVLRVIPSAVGSALEIAVSHDAQGFRLERDPAGRRLTLVLSRSAGGGFEPFAPEGPPGPRSVRSIVLDPGHGGQDAGVTSGSAAEKNLTLALARLLAPELSRRLHARVVLTRGDDRLVAPEQRAEAANRARADLVLSLHFDAFVTPMARGVTVWCPPAVYGGAAAPVPGANASQSLLPWRDVATRHAVESRELADAVISAIELRRLGPARLRERLPRDLLGVDAPGLLIECGTLTSPADRERLLKPEGLRALAIALAEGVQVYQRHE